MNETPLVPRSGEAATMKRPAYSVVIPVFNSNRSLGELVERLRRVFEETMQVSYEVVLVDDGSTREETWKAVHQLATREPNVRAFRLARNFGQASALLCGMSKARGRWVITMDDDLQHRPEDIPELAKMNEHDVVLARFSEKKWTAWKRLTSALKERLDVLVLNKPRGLAASSFRIIKREIVQEIIKIRTTRPFMIALILSLTNDIVNADVVHEPRKFGKSNYSLWRSLSLFSNMIFNNSTCLLKMMIVLGFSMAAVNFIVGIILSISRMMQSQPIQGWTSLIVTVLFCSGAIIFCIGVLGEYVGRLMNVAESRPLWVVRDQVENADS